MAVITIPIVLAFGIVLSIVEIPKMLQQKLIRELVAFSVLLISGSVLSVLKSLKVEIPNPNDILVWFFSPLHDLMMSLSK
jgi:hypothetical protein